jgi:hypothetical protein
VATKDTDSGMATDDRHVYGPRPLSALVPRLTRPAFRRRAPATAQVLSDWAGIVGPAIAAVTTPRRLSAGTLTIACAGPIAMELQYLSSELIGRINAHLGSQTVAALRFVQTATVPTPPPPVQTVASNVTAEANAAVQTLPEGELRAALSALGRAVLSQKPRNRLPPRPLSREAGEG